MQMHNPAHPGEVIREMCLEPLSLTVTEAAAALGVSRKALSDLLKVMPTCRRTWPSVWKRWAGAPPITGYVCNCSVTCGAPANGRAPFTSTSGFCDRKTVSPGKLLNAGEGRGGRRQSVNARAVARRWRAIAYRGPTSSICR